MAVPSMTAPAKRALTPDTVADGIKLLTAKSQALQGPAQSITIINAPLIVIGQGPFPVCRVPIPTLLLLTSRRRSSPA